MKLSLTTFLTLDGVYQAPGGPTEDTSGGFTHGGWLVPFFDEDLGTYMSEVFVPAQGFVLGRKTYDIFAASWPKMNDPDDPIGGKLNSLPKYVASTTLSAADWNNSTILDGDVATAVAKLKERPGGELQIHGSGNLAQTLFDANLIDVFHFLIFPVVLGTGKRLFGDGRTPSSLKLTDLKSSASGVTMQTFDYNGAPTYGEVEIE